MYRLGSRIPDQNTNFLLLDYEYVWFCKSITTLLILLFLLLFPSVWNLAPLVQILYTFNLLYQILYTFILLYQILYTFNLPYQILYTFILLPQILYTFNLQYQIL